MPFYTENRIKDKGNGFIADIVVAAFDAAGVDADIMYQPLARAIVNLKRGNFVAFVGSKENFLSELDTANVDIMSLYRVNGYFFYFKSHMKKEVTDMEFKDLRKYRVGSVIGSVMADDLRKAGIYIELTPNLDQGILKLASGRIDLLITVAVAAYHLVSKHCPEKLDDLDFIKKPLFSVTLDVTFSKAHKDYEEMKELYQKGLKIIRDNGVFEDILRKYFGNGLMFENIRSSFLW